MLLGIKKHFIPAYIMQAPSIHLIPFTATKTILTYSLTTVLQDAFHSLGQVELIRQSSRLHEMCMHFKSTNHHNKTAMIQIMLKLNRLETLTDENYQRTT